MQDLVGYIKGLEKEFLNENKELKESNLMEFLRKREEFVSERLVERRENGEE
mgnify:CR=1 FL=1